MKPEKGKLLVLCIVCLALLAACAGAAADLGRSNPSTPSGEMTVVSSSSLPSSSVLSPVHLEFSPAEYLFDRNETSPAIAYQLHNSTGEAVSFLAHPSLERLEGGQWQPVPWKDGVGVCGTQDPLPEEYSSLLPLHTFYEPLPAGQYRLGFPVTFQDGTSRTVSAEFSLDHRN